MLVNLAPKLYNHLFYSNDWVDQPDNINEVKFVKKPNIYVIQLDGYANPDELKKTPYSFDNSEFETYIKQEGFKSYSNYRSNYYSTLSSNSSLFTMKHHYYSNPKKAFQEVMNSREIIAGDNPVILPPVMTAS